MPTVFVVQDPQDKNILPARDHGTLLVMLQHSDIAKGTEHCIERMAKLLQDMQQGDFILPIGDPVLIGIAFHMAFTLLEGRVKVLRWNREKYTYNPETLRI